jgi:hypothetical protein
MRHVSHLKLGQRFRQAEKKARRPCVYKAAWYVQRNSCQTAKLPRHRNPKPLATVGLLNFSKTKPVLLNVHLINVHLI